MPKTASASLEAVLWPFADIAQQEDPPRKHMALVEVLETRAVISPERAWRPTGC
ncbi:hypothetical protein ILP92_16580 [Maribius pontilimi]|uniref:Uncharacterized protein n=1 Tax=Palleronia pontilimi TaxID=1964209 RepID=A0A934MDW8_9RHOB|nr:hypothetical protein [Palleronia pontilimi]MBJ3764358.1 hypothetical protein [Palleronia pontilimi]